MIRARIQSIARRNHLARAQSYLASILSALTLGIAAAPSPSPLQKAASILPSPNSSPTNSTEAHDGSDNSGPSLETKLTEARANLASTLARGDADLTNSPTGVSPQDVWLRRGLLRRLVRLYEQQASYADELVTTRTRKTEAAREAQAWSRFTEPLPYSILLPDRLHEEIEAERLKIRTGEAATSMIEQLLGENQKALTKGEERIRQFNEAMETVKEAQAGARLSWQRDLERLRNQVAAATIAVLDLENLIRQEAVAESRLRLALFQRQYVLADAGAKFTQADLDTITARVERRREAIEREMTQAQARRPAALQALESARAELRRVQAQPDADPTATTRALETVSLRETELTTADTSIQVLRLMLEGLNVERLTWELRFAAYDSKNVETLNDSRRRLGVLATRVDLWKERQRQQLDVSSSDLQIQESRLNALSLDSDLSPLVRERLAALRQTDQLLLRFLRAIEQMERLVQRWDEELRTSEEKLPLLGRLQNLFADARSFLRHLWTFELFNAEDTITVEGQKITGKRSVTIGKIVMAIIILVLGYWITGLISRVMQPIIVRRLKIEANQATLIRRWLRAAMVACLVLFSLISVKIPLTVFAFAGGALAIGLGFGMQTLLKNFVSGLILLFERPFRVGDVLDVGGHRGTVTGIGLRASVLQLWDGTETLIPNSSLLEGNVTNWTYSNRRVRFTINVGVAYGSDPRRVITLLGEAADRHGLVEKDPKPQVLFTEFGDSTLTFELRFWVDVSKANAAQVSSDLRLMIAGVFSENGIVIDYPQRDIHLHATGPIPVQMVASTRIQAAEGGTARTAQGGTQSDVER